MPGEVTNGKKGKSDSNKCKQSVRPLEQVDNTKNTEQVKAAGSICRVDLGWKLKVLEQKK